MTVVLAIAAFAGYLWWDSTRDPRDYPESIRDGFLVSCAAGGNATDDQCACALDEVEEDLQLTDFLALERSFAETGVLPRTVAAAVIKCGGTPITPEELSGEGSATTVGPIEEVVTPTSLPSVFEYFDDGVEFPDGGRWVSISGDACEFALVDGGEAFQTGALPRVLVPSQTQAILFQSECRFAPEGAPVDS